jgi:hypothetical protein
MPAPPTVVRFPEVLAQAVRILRPWTVGIKFRDSLSSFLQTGETVRVTLHELPNFLSTGSLDPRDDIDQN